jgi:hypothetical protein
LHIFEGKERGDLDLYFHQSLSPLCEGNPLDLDLGVICGFLPLFFLSYPSIAFVTLVGFGEKVLSTLCVLAIAFGASV